MGNYDFQFRCLIFIFSISYGIDFLAQNPVYSNVKFPTVYFDGQTFSFTKRSTGDRTVNEYNTSIVEVYFNATASQQSSGVYVNITKIVASWKIIREYLSVGITRHHCRKIWLSFLLSCVQLQRPTAWINICLAYKII